MMEANIELMYAAEQWRKTYWRPKPPWDKLSVHVVGDKSIAVHSMKQALTLSSTVAGVYCEGELEQSGSPLVSAVVGARY